MVMALSPEVTFRYQTMVEPAHDPAGHPGGDQQGGREHAQSLAVVTKSPLAPKWGARGGRPIS